MCRPATHAACLRRPKKRHDRSRAATVGCGYSRHRGPRSWPDGPAPLRAAPVLAATVKPTVPFPLPVAPDEIVMNVALLVAVHAQPEPAVTGTEPVPPAAPKDDAVTVPTDTVQEGAGVPFDESLLQPTDAMTIETIVAVRKRRCRSAMKASFMKRRRRGRHANASDRRSSIRTA